MLLERLISRFHHLTKDIACMAAFTTLYLEELAKTPQSIVHIDSELLSDTIYIGMDVRWNLINERVPKSGYTR
jgi:hypothetical protein